MDRATESPYRILAQGFAYPAPGRLDTLLAGLAALPDGPTKRAFGEFVRGLQPLSLGAWEELSTHTLDLDPPAAPYVGYQTWGDSYQRGTFLATMSRALRESGVDPGGELPDHLAVILAYLAHTAHPLPELVEILDPAIDRIIAALRSSEPANPYISLFEAVRAECQVLKKENA